MSSTRTYGTGIQVAHRYNIDVHHAPSSGGARSRMQYVTTFNNSVSLVGAAVLYIIDSWPRLCDVRYMQVRDGNPSTYLIETVVLSIKHDMVFARHWGKLEDDAMCLGRVANVKHMLRDIDEMVRHGCTKWEVIHMD